MTQEKFESVVKEHVSNAVFDGRMKAICAFSDTGIAWEILYEEPTGNGCGWTLMVFVDEVMVKMRMGRFLPDCISRAMR